MMDLRPYQTDTVAAICTALNEGMKAPCVSVATGGGKTWILTALAKRFIDKKHDIAVLTHSRELIRQIERTAKQFIPSIGVIATGLGRNDGPRSLQIGQIQTVGRRPKCLGPRSIIIIDECHCLNAEQGLYKKTIDAAREMRPDCRIVGLSATPFRTSTGLIYGPGQIFDECVHRVGMRELIDQEWLTPIVGKDYNPGFKVEGVATRCGDYAQGELEAFMADQLKVNAAVDDFVPRLQDRRQVLVFSTGIKHNEMLARSIGRYDQRVATIDGTMLDSQRDRILDDFRAGKIKYLVNCAILTTGYDDPGIDAIVMVRPTKSPGLLIQCAGRGLRKDPRKTNCMFLDYGGCLGYFGPLDQIEESITVKKKGPPGAAPTKVCDCGTVLHASALKCPDCGKEFPRPLNHEEKASDCAVLSGQDEVREVSGMEVRKHRKPGRPETLRIDYYDTIGMPIASEWLSVSTEADLYAYNKSLKTLADWPQSPFTKVGDTLTVSWPSGVVVRLDFDGILQHARKLIRPKTITVRRNGKHYEIRKKHYE